LPFSPPVHTPVSVHQVPGLQEKDTLTSEPAVSRLRLAWNLGWHENIENLSKVKGVERDFRVMTKAYIKAAKTVSGRPQKK